MGAAAAITVAFAIAAAVAAAAIAAIRSHCSPPFFGFNGELLHRHKLNVHSWGARH